jgi:transcriptional regulator with XRE-family HTH domain
MNEYHYTECGLDNVYLSNGFEISKDEIFIHDIHGLQRAIGFSLVFKSGLLQGNEVKFIRTTLDFTQKRLGEILGCSYQTILLWEKNKAPISIAADRLLRIIFFEYLNPEKNRKIYDLINEIANFDAEGSSNKKIVFEEVADQWQVVA